MKLQKYITICLCTLFVLFFSVWCFFIATPDYSDAERRSLAKMPEVTWESIRTGAFAEQFEEYTTDRFPLRDFWRSVKAYTRLGLFGQKENNDLFVKDGHISKIEYPLDTKMLDYAANLLTKVRDEHFPQNKAYIAVIPDKNAYLADLKLNYDELERYMHEKLEFCTPIRIGHLLSAEDYYRTDSHWKQECIVDVAQHLAAAMGTEIPEKYESKVLTTEFMGVYAGQSALRCEPDTITYLENDMIGGFRVTGAEAVYDTVKAEGKDPYEFFLSGNQPLVKIQNPNAASDKKLVIFRDSFASSLAPLLAQGYAEVTLADLRYMNSSLVGEHVDFTDADVLFLYSSGILNNSTSMR